MSLRVGLLGGTFDPIHAGHLALATACADALDLHEVLLLTNRTPPHKPQACATGPHRHAMVALATAEHPRLVADPRELERQGPSWTIDTLEELTRERPEASLFFLLGADSLGEITTWHRWRDVLAACVVAATGRAGHDLDAALAAIGPDARGRVASVHVEPPPWRSRELREALAARGAAPSGALEPAVADYIRKNALYAARPPRHDEVPAHG